MRPIELPSARAADRPAREPMARAETLSASIDTNFASVLRGESDAEAEVKGRAAEATDSGEAAQDGTKETPQDGAPVSEAAATPIFGVLIATHISSQEPALAPVSDTSTAMQAVTQSHNWHQAAATTVAQASSPTHAVAGNAEDAPQQTTSVTNTPAHIQVPVTSPAASASPPAAPKDIHAATKPPAEAGATAAQTPERAVQDVANALPDAGPHQQSTDHPPQDRQHDTPKPQELLTQAKDANGGQTVAPALQNAAQPKADANPPQFAALTPPPSPGLAAASAPPPPSVLYTQAPAVPLTPDMIALTIARKAQDGLQTFEIRLDPPELGALEVNLSFDELGRTQAQIRAERPEALELLQREAKGLEQALRQAGITLEQGALNFQLAGRQTADDRGGHGQGRRAKLAAALPADQIQSMAIDAGQRHIGALDLRV